MKKQSIIYLTAWFTSFLFLAGLTSAFAAPTIEKIEFDSSAKNVDRIIFKLNGPYLPKTFALKGDRPRVVLDFTDTVPTKAVKNILEADGKFIKQIRTGIHPGKTRVVFDLVSGEKADFKQNFDSASNTLIITVFPAGTKPPAPVAMKVESSPAPGKKTAPALTHQAAAEPEAAPPAPAHQVAAEPEATPPAPAKTPEPAAEPAPETKPAAAMTETPPMPAPVKPAVPEKAPAKAEQQQMASIPPSMEKKPGKPHEEATTIRPLSEIGEHKAVGTGKSPTLYSIEFDKNSSRGEMIIFKLNTFNPPVVFGIEEDVPRIVCFFKDTSAGDKLQDDIKSDGRFVKNIQVGKYRNPDNIRVVLDLAPSHNYDLQQVFFKEDNLFMIIINTAGDKAAKSNS